MIFPCQLPVSCSNLFVSSGSGHAQHAVIIAHRRLCHSPSLCARMEHDGSGESMASGIGLHAPLRQMLIPNASRATTREGGDTREPGYTSPSNDHLLDIL